MKSHPKFVQGALLLLSSAALNYATLAAPTVISYQGNLRDNGQPATGLYDLRLSLSDSQTGGNYVGSTITNPAVPVTTGLFTVALDFGLDVFGGQSRWLEMAVRTNGSVLPYTTLSPRTPIQSTPYALRAQTGGSETLKLLGGTTAPLPYTGYDFSFGVCGTGTTTATNLFTFERTCTPKALQDIRILLMQRPTNSTPVFVRAEVWGVIAATLPNDACTTYLQEFATFRRAVTVETNIASVPAGTWVSVGIESGAALGINQDELLTLRIRGGADWVGPCCIYWEGLGRAIVRDQ